MKSQWPQHAEQLPGTLIMIPSLLSTRARHLSGGTASVGQKTSQDGGSRSVQASASRHLDCFQVPSAALPPRPQHYLEKRLDFPCDFLMNVSSRFFSASVQPVWSGSTGRKRQICSFTAVT